MKSKEQISFLQNQLPLVYRIPAEPGLAKNLLAAVKNWQAGLKSLKPGEPHPEGCCSVAVASVLLFELTKGKPPQSVDNSQYEKFLKVVGSLISITTAKVRVLLTHAEFDTLVRHSCI